MEEELRTVFIRIMHKAHPRLLAQLEKFGVACPDLLHLIARDLAVM